MDKRVRKFYENLGFRDPLMYNYFEKNVTYIDMDKNSCNSVFIGCFFNIKNNKLYKIHPSIPVGNDIKYLSQQVHEVAHFIFLYQYLNKNLDLEKISDGIEIFPIAMERLFAEKSNDSNYLEWFNNYQKELIKKSIDKDKTTHIIGFLNHWDYLDLYRENNRLPILMDFKSNNLIDTKTELKKKISR